MYRIGIIGHSPEHFSIISPDEVKRTISETIQLLKFQYSSAAGHVIFNVAGETGVGLWAANECLKLSEESLNTIPYEYHMFLSCPISFLLESEEIFDEQKKVLSECYNHTRSITICNKSKNNNTEEELETYKQLINNSNFVICFWVGKKQGKTFEAIKYALTTNKMALNGLDGLRLITNEDLKKHRKNT